MKYKEAIKNVLIAEGDGAWDPLLSLAEMPAVQESPHEDEGDTSSGEAGEEGGGDAKAAAPPSTRDLDEWGFPVATTS